MFATMEPQSRDVARLVLHAVMIDNVDPELMALQLVAMAEGLLAGKLGDDEARVRIIGALESMARQRKAGAE